MQTTTFLYPCRKEHGDSGHSQCSVFCMPLIFANLPWRHWLGLDCPSHSTRHPAWASIHTLCMCLHLWQASLVVWGLLGLPHANTFFQQVIFTCSMHHALMSDHILLTRHWLIHRYNVYKVASDRSVGFSINCCTPCQGPQKELNTTVISLCSNGTFYLYCCRND